ncbi:MAG: ABC transporter ATP-binding protein [Bifidobacteriaceae bacterium]|jgi:peptide/nickel transport system ATP-binding protein|nr:ABC transporter ATP-binding protein [Bifidobacteriaceae bacterium]
MTALDGSDADILLEVDDLTVSYHMGMRRPPFRAVRDITFKVARGETVSIVGESGSGKSTIGGAILGLRAIESGSIRLQGEDITNAGIKRRRAIARHIQAVFQDPFSSLDPKLTIGESVAEPLTIGARPRRDETLRSVTETLGRVGIGADALRRFPAEFSGGQRQRVSIARSIIRTPELIVCDEAVSALDVSVQAQVINLLADLKADSGTSYLFISHNMAVVRHISDRVIVLYKGRIMEQGPAADVCDQPAHPYTRSLIAAVPVPNVAVQEQRRTARSLAAKPSVVAGDVQDGCPFAPRCPFARPACTTSGDVRLVGVGPGRSAACLRLDEVLRTASASPVIW